MAVQVKKKAAIYCRISLDKKLGTDDERAGVKRQLNDCQLMCRMNGYEIYDIYEDNSVSAHGTELKKAKERAGYNRMLDDFKAGKFDVIVAWKLDRLTRSVAGLEDMLRELAGQGLCICTTDLGGSEQDLGRADAVMLAQLMASFAQFESSRKSERMKTAIADRARQGIMRSGKRSFGYDGHNNVVEDEAVIVRAIYEAYDKGSSMNAITRALRGEDDGTLPDFPTSDPVTVIDAKRQGKEPPSLKWSMGATATILRNPKYAGYIYHAPLGEDGKHQPYDSNWREWIVRDDEGNFVKGKNFEAIVDEELWWRVQDKRDENLKDSKGRVIPRKGGRKSIGSGLYLCSECGRPLKSGGRANFRGHDYGMTYYCKGHVSRVSHHVDKFVLATVKARLARPDLKDLLFRPEDNSERLREIREEIKSINGRIAQTERDYDEDLIDARTRKRKLDKLEAKKASLEGERLELSAGTVSSEVIDAPDPVAAFEALTDPRQIANVIDTLCVVTVHPHERGKRVTPESLAETVRIEWKR